MSTLVSAVVGALVATLSIVGVVQSQSSTPEPVSEPLVVYGER